jgi:hypothetical protein
MEVHAPSHRRAKSARNLSRPCGFQIFSQWHKSAGRSWPSIAPGKVQAKLLLWMAEAFARNTLQRTTHRRIGDGVIEDIEADRRSAGYRISTRRHQSKGALVPHSFLTRSAMTKYRKERT